MAQRLFSTYTYEEPASIGASLELDDEEKKDVFDFISSGGFTGSQDTALDLIDRQQKEWKRNVEIQESRSKTTLGDWAEATAYTYMTNTMVGSLMEKFGLNKYTVDDGEFKEQEGFSVDVDSALPLLYQMNANEDEVQGVLSSKSPEHYQAKLEALQTKRDREELVNMTLTESQQKFAHISSVLDLDIALSLFMPIGAARGLYKVGDVGRRAMATASGLVSASKPLLVNETFEQGKSGEQLAWESALYGGLEFLATLKLTPELKAQVSTELSDSIIRKQIVGQGGTIRQVDIPNEITSWATKPEDLIAIPRATDDVSSMIDNTVSSLVQKEMVNIVGEKLNASGVKAEIAGFAHASNDIDDMFKSIQTRIIDNPDDIVGVARAFTSIKKELMEFVTMAKDKIKFADGEYQKLYDEVVSSLDDFEQTALLSQKQVRIPIVKQAIKDLKAGGIKALEQYGDVSIIKALEKDIAKLENTIKATRSAKKLKDMNQQLSDMKSIMDKEIRNATSRAERELIRNETKGVKLVKTDGGYMFGNKLIPTAVVLGLFGASGAFAKDEDGTAGDVILSGVQALVVLGVVAGFTPMVYGKYRTFKAIQDRVNAVSAQTQRIHQEATVRAKVLNSVKTNFEFVRSSFTETFNPLTQYLKAEKNESAIKFIQDVLVDPMMGKSDAGEITKVRRLHQAQAEYRTAEVGMFKQWWKAQERNDALSYFEAFTGKGLEEFRNYVTSIKDGVGEVPLAGREFVEQFAQQSTKIFEKHGLDSAIEIGLDGTSSVRMLEEYVRRSHKSSAQSVYRMLTEESMVALKDNFKKMYMSAVGSHAKVAESSAKMVEKMFSGVTDMSQYKTALKEQSKSFEGFRAIDEEFDELLKTAENASDLVEARIAFENVSKYIKDIQSEVSITNRIDDYFKHLMNDNFRGGVVADVAGTLKKRLPLDLKVFPKDFVVDTISGEQKILGINQMFERNDYALFNSYMNTMAGRIGLKQSGYSVEQAKAIIETIKEPRAKELAQKALDSMIGVPLLKVDDKVLAITHTTANASVAMALPFVAFSFLHEFGMLANRLMFNPSERSMVLGDIVNIIRGHGDNSAMVAFMKERVGLGLNRDLANIGSRFDVDMREAGILGMEGNMAVSVSQTLRDSVFKYSGMTALSDVLEIANGVANMQRLADIALNQKKFSKAIMMKYGLSIADIDIARKALKLNEKGNVMVPDLNSLTHLEQDRFSNIIWNMNQLGAQKSTLGGTATWTRDNLLGHAVSKLLMYPMNSFANIGLHQLRGMAHGDVETSMSAFFGYVGSYVGVKLRDELMGKTRDEEEYHMYALMNLPIASPMSLARGLTDPAFFKFPQAMASGVGSILSGAIGSE